MFIIAVCAVFFGGAQAVRAQTDVIREPIAGGYSTVETTDLEVVTAANFAVKAQAKKQRAKIKLVNVVRAEQQVVAGRNYQMCLQVEVLEKGRKTAVPQTVQTVVFLNLKQKRSLTSWAIAACADAAPVTPPAGVPSPL